MRLWFSGILVDGDSGGVRTRVARNSLCPCRPPSDCIKQTNITMKLTTNTPNRLLLLLLATPHPLTAEPSSPPPLTVTLPYALYTGVRTPLTTPTNLTLTTWKGIRYASPPVGPLRWQRPQPPAAAAPAPVLAATAGPACPQAMPAIPGLGFVRGEEDCLFLNVWAAASSPSGNNTGLAPVLVVIHGGGYGLGGAGTDMTSFLQGGGEAMVVVEVQYRVHPPPPILLCRWVADASSSAPSASSPPPTSSAAGSSTPDSWTRNSRWNGCKRTSLSLGGIRAG